MGSRAPSERLRGGKRRSRIDLKGGQSKDLAREQGKRAREPQERSSIDLPPRALGHRACRIAPFGAAAASTDLREARRGG